MLLALVMADGFIDFLLDRVEIERGRILHGRVIDGRRSEAADFLLHADKSPELAGEKVVDISEGAVRQRLAGESRRAFKGILAAG